VSLDDPRNPGLETVLDTLRDAILRQILGAMPATVTAYDADAQTISAQLAVGTSYIGPDGARVPIAYSQLQGVPVVFMGGGGARFTWPVAVGDGCLIVFSSVALERWKATGRAGDPADDRRHDINDCFAIVGAHAPASPPTDAPTDAVVIHADNGVEIRLGGSDADSAVVVQDALGPASSLGSFAAALVSAIAAETTAGHAVGAAALTALQTALNALNGGGGWLAGTTKTKAE
jgi:hypothetical protein